MPTADIPRVVLLPIHLADLGLMTLAQQMEAQLYHCVYALAMLQGVCHLLRRDEAPMRWQVSPYASPQDIRQQHHEWAKHAQTNFLLWPSLVTASTSQGDIESSTVHLNCHWVNTCDDTTTAVLSVPLALPLTFADVQAIAHQVMTAIGHQLGGPGPEYVSQPLVPDVSLLAPETTPQQWWQACQHYPKHGWVAYMAGRKLSSFQPKQAMAAYRQSLASGWGGASFQAGCWLALGHLIANHPQNASSVNHSYNDAIQAFEHALACQPNHIGALLALGHTEESRGQLGKAIQVFHTGLQAAPLDMRLHAGLARLHSKQWDWVAAIAHYEAQHQASPNDPWLPSNIAMAYLQLDDTQQARHYLEKTRLLDSDGEAGATAQLILSQLS